MRGPKREFHFLLVTICSILISIDTVYAGLPHDIFETKCISFSFTLSSLYSFVLNAKGEVPNPFQPARDLWNSNTRVLGMIRNWLSWDLRTNSKCQALGLWITLIVGFQDFRQKFYLTWCHSK